MASFLDDSVLDAALNVIKNGATTLYICNALPTTYAAASSTNKLGTKTSITISAPADRSPTGRYIRVSAITDGTVNTSGTASHWAITGTSATLYAASTLSSAQAVTATNQFTLDAIDIGIPDPA